MSIIKAPENYYPTPKTLIDKMCNKVKWNYVRYVLEPSAGTGHIVKGLMSVMIDNYNYNRDIKIDCIEYDTELRTILQYNFSGKRRQELNERADALREREHKYNRYIQAVERLKEGNLSECGKRDMENIAKTPVSPLTEAEQEELSLLGTEISELRNYNNVKVVYNDFLNFHTYKQYDLIIMNPPFDKGDLHLLHALDLQKDGGQIICLLNAETIKNPYTNTRQLLKRKLDKYEAEIEFLTGEFATSESERKTDVEVALITVNIPKSKKTSFIIEGLRKAKEETKTKEYEATELTTGSWIKQMVDQFNFELAAIKKLVDEYNAMVPYMSTGFNSDFPILKLCIGNTDIQYCDNEYVSMVRRKYWNEFFNKPEFEKLLTSNLKKKYDNIVDSMEDYDFTEYNIYTVMQDLKSSITGSIGDTILDLFETLTAEYSWFGEGDKNIHYYNGWKTNKAWIINKKVIIPMNGAFAYDSFYKKYDDTFNLNTVYRELSDIEKALDYLDGGHNTNDTDLKAVLEAACTSHISRKIECKYFNVTVYKKGTCHIEFTDLDLLKKLNLYGSQKKGWLPPSYGKKAYKDMTEDEKAVIDDFEGEESYTEMLANKDYYLSGTSNILMLEG